MLSSEMVSREVCEGLLLMFLQETVSGAKLDGQRSLGFPLLTNNSTRRSHKRTRILSKEYVKQYIYIYNIHKVLKSYYLRISSKYFHILKNLFFHVLIFTMPHLPWFSVQSTCTCLCVVRARAHTHTIKQTPNPNPTVSHYLKDDCDLSVLVVGASSLLTSTFSDSEAVSGSKSSALKIDSMVSLLLLVKLFESMF